MPYYYPQKQWLAFVKILPEYFVIIALEITEGKTYSLLVNSHQSIKVTLRISQSTFIIEFKIEVKFSLVDVNFVLEETCHVWHVLKEGRFQERYLAVKARNLSYLVYEVQNAWGNVDNLDAHNFEELPQKLTGLLNEIDH